MPTVTSRRSPPASKPLAERRKLAQELIGIERKLAPEHARAAAIEAGLKKIATLQGESFKEDFGAQGTVSASGAVAAEFKGELPQVVTEAWLKLTPAERKTLTKSGVIAIVREYGRASSGRVTVKLLLWPASRQPASSSRPRSPTCRPSSPCCGGRSTTARASATPRPTSSPTCAQSCRT